MRKNRKEARKKKSGDELWVMSNEKKNKKLITHNPLLLTNFQRKLLTWYHKNKRDLPWRQTKDPYKIWLSEIMLQQTQVKTVIDYYHRFLTRFPTIQDLAKANEEEVLTLWSGLGYYSRARNLYKGAKEIVEKYDAKFPSNPQEILSLPGIGKYTLGAIASIAFEQPLPLVDGNVMRVYSRVFAISGNPQESKFQKKIWKMAETLIPKKNSGDFNQALMELGATICSPTSPNCSCCPIKKICKATNLNPEKFPQKKERQKTKKLFRLAALLIHQKKICLILPENTRWQKGLWQLPGTIIESEKNFENEMKIYLGKEKIAYQSFKPLPLHIHQITHHKITIYPYQIDLKITPELQTRFCWIDLKKLNTIAIPAADRKILESLEISS